MLLPNKKKRFFLLIWFRYIFLSFSYLLFFNLGFCKKFDNKLNLLLLKNNIAFKKVLQLNYIFNFETYFNFLSSDYLLIYVNNVNNLFSVVKDELQLFSFSYKGFFINSNYLLNIHDYYMFYTNNYLYLIKYLQLFCFVYTKIIALIRKVMNMTIRKLIVEEKKNVENFIL